MVAHDTKAPVRTAQLIARLPAFSPVALRLMAIISDENVSFKQVTELIRLDPALSGEVLSLANSGLYGRRFPVRSIMHAMALVGIRKVGSIVITAALWKALPRRGSPFISAWWRHAVAAALVAEHVTSGSPGMDPSYTGGLLHAVGQLALFQHSPDHYVDGVKFCCSTGTELLDYERDAFGIDHAALGDAILQKWGLADDLRDAVASHHAVGSLSSDLAGAVQTACLASEYAGFGTCGCHRRIAAGELSEPVQNLIDSGYLLDVLPQEINGIECSLT
jgi:putative nucleotidyltransferase with HDIG domain